MPLETGIFLGIIYLFFEGTLKCRKLHHNWCYSITTTTKYWVKTLQNNMH